MALVSITRLRLRAWRFFPMFLWYALGSARQAKKAEGSLAVRLLREQRNTFWTATSWTDEEAMKKFMLGEPHRTAMRKLLQWCDEAAVVHWSQGNGALPTWPEAYARMRKEGRRSKVNHPTPAHLAFEFPEPKGVSQGEARSK
jgi:Domain of unknown function (DUF3291)